MCFTAFSYARGFDGLVCVCVCVCDCVCVCVCVSASEACLVVCQGGEDLCALCSVDSSLARQAMPWCVLVSSVLGHVHLSGCWSLALRSCIAQCEWDVSGGNV